MLMETENAPDRSENISIFIGLVIKEHSKKGPICVSLFYSGNKYHSRLTQNSCCSYYRADHSRTERNVIQYIENIAAFIIQFSK